MNKMLIVTVLATALSLNGMAQENFGQQGRPRMDRSEMIQRRTEAMAQQYGLNAKQQKKLLKLNNKYPEAMPFAGGPRMGGPRNGMGPGRGNNGQGRPQGPPPGNGDNRPQAGQGQPGQPGQPGQGQMGQGGPWQRGQGQMGQRGPGQRGPGMGRGGMRGPRQADPAIMEKYEKNLRKIMTPEQFAKYQADRKAQEERRRQMGNQQPAVAPNV